jgi:hypothetical protein
MTNVHKPPGGDGLPPWWPIVIGVVATLALIFIAGVGFGQEWGAEQWGPVAAWLWGALTLAAVVVALRQATVAQRQAVIAQQQADAARRETIRLQFDRLVDHEISRRRECIDALSDLWGAIVSIGPAFLAFTQGLDDIDPKLDLFQQHTPSGVRGSRIYADELAERIRDFFGQWLIATLPPLFRARLVLRGTPLQGAVKQINNGLGKVSKEGTPTITGPISQGRKPDTTAITTMWQDLLRLRDGHMELAEKHFSLIREDAAEAVRQNRLQG